MQDCIKEAMESKKISIEDVPFTFSHYTRTSASDLNVDSEGWTLSAVIKDAKVAPTSLKYTEFVNP